MRDTRENGFTLIEIMVVVAIIAVLAALMLPALLRGKERSRQMFCISNLKQLQAGWQMYCNENDDTMPLNEFDGKDSWSASLPNSWVIGNARAGKSKSDIERGTLFRYVPNVAAFRCPSDQSTIHDSNLPRLRSYALEGRLNGLNGSIQKSTEIRNPTDTFAFIDEEEQSIDDGLFLIRRFPDSLWPNMPADRHILGANLSFADGHCVRLKWKVPKRYKKYDAPTENPEDLADLRTLQSLLANPP